MSAEPSAYIGPRVLVTPLTQPESPSESLLSEAESDATGWEDFTEAYFEELLQDETGEAELEDRFEGYDPGMESERDGSYETGYASIELEGDLETMAFEGDDEAESPRQDDLAMEAELGVGETPPVESWEAEDAGVVPSNIAAFATTLGAEWSKRRNGTPIAEAITKWLLDDYRDTLEAARKRWSQRVGKGQFTLDALGRAWMVSRREQMGFQAGTRGVNPLGSLTPPTGAVSLVSTDLVEDSKTAPVAPLVVSFMKELRQRYKSYMRAANYRGHGGGKFYNRGFSLDLYIKGLDERGFYPKDEAIRFLQKLHEAATAVNAQWRIIYNDFAVADVVNRALGREHVIFVGTTRKTGGRVTGLNWHGPAPLILHFHLDLAPLAGAASKWSGSAGTLSTSVDSTSTVSGGATTSAAVPTGGLAELEHQLLLQVQASWQRASLTPPTPASWARCARKKMAISATSPRGCSWMTSRWPCVGGACSASPTTTSTCCSARRMSRPVAGSPRSTAGIVRS